jgi:hypothetical protein
MHELGERKKKCAVDIIIIPHRESCELALRGEAFEIHSNVIFDPVRWLCEEEHKSCIVVRALSNECAMCIVLAFSTLKSTTAHQHPAKIESHKFCHYAITFNVTAVCCCSLSYRSPTTMIFIVYCSADGEYVVTTLTKAILHYTGRVYWNPPGKLALISAFALCLHCLLCISQPFLNRRARLTFDISRLISRHAS